MQRLGVKGFRFSIAWPRVFPQGTGTPNPKGIDFYKRLVDALHAADIEPFCTLFHWDLPQALAGQRRLDQPRHQPRLCRLRRTTPSASSPIASATG